MTKNFNGNINIDDLFVVLSQGWYFLKNEILIVCLYVYVMQSYVFYHFILALSVLY